MTTAIVFDLDGTLADSSSCIVDAAHYVGKVLRRVPVKDEDIEAKIGQPLELLLSSLFDLEEPSILKACKLYSAEYLRLAKTEEKLFKGALSLIKDLHKAQFKLAIATGKSQNGAQNSTTRLGLAPWFDSIHGILPGTPGKPDPAVLIRAMNSLNVDPQDCIMVGDTVFDLELAKKVGVRTAAVSWGVHSVEKLEQLNPDFLASSFVDLQKWLMSHQ